MRRPRGERSAAGAGRRLESCNFHECWLVQHVVHVKAGTQSCGYVWGAWRTEVEHVTKGLSPVTEHEVLLGSGGHFWRARRRGVT